MSESRSRNHIESAVVLYNTLVDFIEDLYRDVYPEDQYWSRMSAFEMLEALRNSASYEKKYNELLGDNLREAQARSANLLTSILEASNLLQGIDIEDERHSTIETTIDMLEIFKEKEEGKTPSKRGNGRRTKVLKDLNVSHDGEY